MKEQNEHRLLKCLLHAGVLFCLSANLCASLTPSNLTCQGMANPQGIDAANPNLSWISISSDPTDRGQVQTAFQILVADSESVLNSNVGNLWDSGKIAGDRSIHIAYAGTSLQAHQACFWKVRIWDKDNAVSPWSQPGS